MPLDDLVAELTFYAIYCRIDPTVYWPCFARKSLLTCGFKWAFLCLPWAGLLFGRLMLLATWIEPDMTLLSIASDMYWVFCWFSRSAPSFPSCWAFPGYVFWV